MRSILLCVDGSDCAMLAAEYAIALSKLMNAYIDVLYVSDFKEFEMATIADFGGSVGIQPFQEMLTSVTNLENGKADVLEKRISKLFLDAELTDRFKFHHRNGFIIDILAEFKKDLTGLDLIVLGKYGNSSDKTDGHIGQTLEGVLRSTQDPCLVVSQKYSPIKKILIAYDGSESATKAIHFLERNLCFKKCEIHILAVDPDKELRDNIKEAESILSNIVGLNITTVRKKTGNPAEVIIKYIDEHKFDLLMMGAFNHSIIKCLLTGSTTIDLLEMSKTSIMVFK